LKQRNSIALPDEILSKEKEGAHPGYLDSLQLLRKTAKYLVDLDQNDKSFLESERVRIFLMKNSVSWRVLRQLKRIARSSEPGQPLPDVLLLGENGVGKSTFARAYDALRRTPEDGRIGFMSEDLGTLDMQGGSAPSLRLFGSTGWYEFKDDPSAWTLGSFSRATAYKQGNKRLRFVTQEFRQGNGKLQENREPRQVNETLYPTEDYVADYDASATLFLDEVVNISDEMQAMLLQALGYDRERRHVFTTGRVSRRVPVGPAIVMATRKDIDEMARKDDGVSLALRDYLYRIDHGRVRIPPLRERKSEIIPFLKRAVGNRRQKTRPEISVDPRVEHVLMHDLRYDNNFADLERIADQVQAEEETITFSHVRALYEREVLKDLREEIGQKLMTVEGCIEYLEKVEKEKIPQSITDLQNNPNFSPSMVYRIGCSLFIHKLDAKATEWPNNEQTMAYFGENKGGFKASLSRLGDRIWSADPNLSEEDRKALAGLGGVQRQIEIMVSEQAARTGRTTIQASPTEKATKPTRRRSTRANGSSAGV
jgi:energy-coupling factor transporter ATP-binding protein EcfA2